MAGVSHPVPGLGKDGGLQLSRAGKLRHFGHLDGAALTMLLPGNKAIAGHAVRSNMYHSCCAC